MRILLINPPRHLGRTPVSREDRCEAPIPNVVPPMGLVYLATWLLEKRYDVELIDANGHNLSNEKLEALIAAKKPDCVILKATPETFYNDVKVADVSKKVNSDVQTILICWTLSTLYGDVLQRAASVDYYITDFYYERPILEILSGKEREKIAGIAFREGDTVVATEPTHDPAQFSSLHLPAWHLIKDFSIYWLQVPSISPWTFVMSIKGCGMGCTFCAISDIKPSFRDTNAVVDEIDYLVTERGLRYISFFDATFNTSRARVFNLCNELIARGLDKKCRWYAYARASITKEEAQAMREAGCRGISIGVESGSQAVLDQAHKRIRVSQCEEAIKNLRSAGIKQYTSFIVGLPGETRETLRQTVKFIQSAKPTGFEVFSLVPYPRSPIYDRAVQEGKMKCEFEDLLIYNTPVSLCDLSVDEINSYRKRIYREIYLHPGWWLTNLREVIRDPEDIKQGISYALKVTRRLLSGVEYDN
jgi:anaerobic magnesium-protoporphyrin IX monomethyl ester cyclase